MKDEICTAEQTFDSLYVDYCESWDNPDGGGLQFSPIEIKRALKHARFSEEQIDAVRDALIEDALREEHGVTK